MFAVVWMYSNVDVWMYSHVDVSYYIVWQWILEHEQTNKNLRDTKDVVYETNNAAAMDNNTWLDKANKIAHRMQQ